MLIVGHVIQIMHSPVINHGGISSIHIHAWDITIVYMCTYQRRVTVKQRQLCEL